MKPTFLIRISLVLFIFVLIVGLGVDFINSATGQVIEEHNIGPSVEEQTCVRACASRGCEPNDMVCMRKNSEVCLVECNVQKPEVKEETSCMEECVQVGCSEFDFSCQATNKDKCEKECNMIKEPEAKSEEEQCIRDCVNKVQPGLICRPGEGGEKGDDVCQRCAQECVHLYAGPCLNEEKLEAKKNECNTCEHCYGEPIMGDSGEGYECIVNVECKDASAMFGDDPGTGEGIPLTEASGDSEGEITSRISEGIGDVFASIGNFFSGIFGSKNEVEAPAETPQAVAQE